VATYIDTDARATKYRHVKPTRGLEKAVPMRTMSIVVSRYAQWDGIRFPPSTYPTHVIPVESFLTQESAIFSGVDNITQALMSAPISWSPDEENLIVVSFCDGEYQGAVLNDDLVVIAKLVYDQHQAIQVDLRLKIVRKAGLPPQPTRINSRDTRDVQDVAPDVMGGHWTDALFQESVSSGIAQVAPTVFVPPLVQIKTTSIDDKMARFTKSGFQRVWNELNFPPASRVDAQPMRVKRIKRTLMPHQNLSLSQLKSTLDDMSSGLNADEQGLGKTSQTVAQVWLNRVLLEMEDSIQKHREGDQSSHPHCPPDVPAGTRCPSSDFWPMKCMCEPGSLASRMRYSRRPSLVICNVQTTIPTWAREVDEFCSSECPFQLKSVIGHRQQKSLTGYTRAIKGNSRSKKSYQEAVEKTQLACDPDECYEDSIAACYVVISTKESVWPYVFKLLGLQQEDTRNISKKSINFHMFVIDESHLITGESTLFVKHTLLRYTSSKKDTGRIPCDEDTRKIDMDDWPTQFLLLSGTPWKELSDLKPYWHTMREQMTATRAIWKLQGDDESMRRMLDTKEAYDRFQRFNLDDEEKKEKRKTTDDQSIHKHSRAFGECMVTVTLRRMADTRIPEPYPFNVPLIRLPRLFNISINVQYDDETLAACNQATMEWRNRMMKKFKTETTKISGKYLFKKFATEVQTSQTTASVPSLADLIKEGHFDTWTSNKRGHQIPNGEIRLTQTRIQAQ
jgi:hypothetical protein